MRTLGPTVEAEPVATGWDVRGPDPMPADGSVAEPAALAIPPRRATRDDRPKEDSRFRRALAAADFAAVLLSLGTVVAIGGGRLALGALLAFPVLVLLVKAVGLYDRDEHLLHKTTLDEVPILFSLATVTALGLSLADGVVVAGHLGRGQVLGLWALLFVSMVALRAIARAAAGSLRASERCLVLGSVRDAELLNQQLEMASSIDAVVAGVMPPLVVSHDRRRIELPAGMGQTVVDERIDRVIVAIPAGVPVGSDGFLSLLRQLKAFGVKVSLLPDGPRASDSTVELDQLPGVTLLAIRGLEIPRSSRFVKRAFDIFWSALGLIVISPVLIAIVIAIRLDTRGPILFRQRRVGLKGRHFTLLKFRSMVTEAEQLKDELRDLNEGGPGLFKIAGDPRVTRVGRVLRRYSLDELPQLWNVLRGEMSLVGPRPLIVEEDGQLQGWHRRRLEVLPGMTGHWQILHSTRRITLAEMARLDYLYVANWTLWNDVRLLLRTVPFVVGHRGI